MPIIIPFLGFGRHFGRHLEFPEMLKDAKVASGGFAISSVC